MESANEEALPPRGQLLEQRRRPSPSSASPAPDRPSTLLPSNPTDQANDPGHNGSASETYVPPSNVKPPHGVVPPYWRHSRAASRASQISADRHLITLEDHSEDPASDTSRGLWAKSVTIDDYVVVKGTTGIGAYVVWNCVIQTLQGSSMTVRMRYSEFVELRERLVRAFPHAKKSLPGLPPKSAIFKFSHKFLEARRVGLAYFLNCVLLNPEFSGSPVLKETLFSHST